MPIAANVHLISFLYVHNTPLNSPLSYCYKQFILPLSAVRRTATICSKGLLLTVLEYTFFVKICQYIIFFRIFAMT